MTIVDCRPFLAVGVPFLAAILLLSVEDGLISVKLGALLLP